MSKLSLLAVIVGALAAPTFGAVYKWTDAAGNTHYSSNLPPQPSSAEMIHIRPAASPPQAEPPRAPGGPPAPSSDEPPASGQSAAIEDLGPLPTNTSSRYLVTQSAGITVDPNDLTAQYTLVLSATPDLPPGAYLEADFDKPGDPGHPLVVGKQTQAGEHEIRIASGKFKGLKCWNYQAKVYVYRDSAKGLPLGVHLQTVQSHINLDNIRSPGDFAQARLRGACP